MRPMEYKIHEDTAGRESGGRRERYSGIGRITREGTNRLPSSPVKSDRTEKSVERAEDEAQASAAEIAEKAEAEIRGIVLDRRRVIVAVDGRCAAGKSTLAGLLQQNLNCMVFHMDDFFLQPFQRTAERLAAPGGNVDYERFRAEILLPLREGAAEITYQPYSCRTQSLQKPVTVHPGQISIVEGSYSLCPSLRDYYDLRIFLDVSEEEQAERILRRNGPERFRQFRDRWIPLEEQYFRVLKIRDLCNLCFDTSSKK